MSSTTAVSRTNKHLEADASVRTPGIIYLPSNVPLNNKKSKAKKSGATRGNASSTPPVQKQTPPKTESHLTWQQQLLNNPSRPGPKFDRTLERRDEETFGVSAPKEKRKGKKDAMQHVRDTAEPKTPERASAYAGPTFHNSPAPNSLPAPRFQSRTSKPSQGESAGDVSVASITTDKDSSGASALAPAPVQSPQAAAAAASPAPATAPAATPAPAHAAAPSPRGMRMTDMPPQYPIQPHPLCSPHQTMHAPYGPPGYYGTYSSNPGMPPMMPPHAMPFPMPVGFRPHMMPPYAQPMPGMPMPNSTMQAPQGYPPPLPAAPQVPVQAPTSPARSGGQTVESLLANMLGTPVQTRAT
ncbi:hypothetical protein MCUN1_001879 [Malassezia cuniculi]|uniref:Uncharacterized protein n=1 Tax=Malassezia cuniculi TaxID=948313 RepID=A0AAF0EYQ2_9BASI|nr:hypothetical protein MCUN1_001879 [Malassezia cuniculi]